MSANGKSQSSLLGHGLGAYAEGCRCATCKRAYHNTYMKLWARARREFDPNYVAQRRAISRKSDAKMRRDPERWAKKLLYRRIWAKQHREKRKRKLAQIKVIRGCGICGYNDHPAALDFHHVQETKKAGVAQLMRASVKWERVLEEIAKCELLCANCHRIVSAEAQREPD